MFSLESSQLDVSPAFITSSIIQKLFDRHTDGAVSGHAKSTRPGLSGGVDSSFRALIQLKTFDLTCVGSWVIFSPGDHNAANQKSLRCWGAQTSDSEQYTSLWSCAVFITARMLIVLSSQRRSFHLLSSVVFVFADLSPCTHMHLCDNVLGLEPGGGGGVAVGEQARVRLGVWGEVLVAGSWGDICRRGTTGRWDAPGRLEAVLQWLIFHLFLSRTQLIFTVRCCSL